MGLFYVFFYFSLILPFRATHVCVTQRNKDDLRKEFDAEEARLKEEEGSVPYPLVEEHRSRLEEVR
jgi:hypothetical protein